MIEKFVDSFSPFDRVKVGHRAVENCFTILANAEIGDYLTKLGVGCIIAVSIIARVASRETAALNLWTCNCRQEIQEIKKTTRVNDEPMDIVRVVEGLVRVVEDLVRVVEWMKTHTIYVAAMSTVPLIGGIYLLWPHHLAVFCIATGIVHFFGVSISEACGIAWSIIVLLDIAVHSLEHWPNWQTNDAAAVPVIIGGTLLVIGVKMWEIIELV